MRDDVVVLKIKVGASIRDACERAAAVAAEHGHPAHFDFNGVGVTVTPGQAPSEAVAAWDAEMKRQASEYRSSPEYAEVQRSRREAAEGAQATVNALLVQLPSVLRDRDALVAWCGEYARWQDDTGVDGHKRRVADLLASAGYRPGDCVGHPLAGRDRGVTARWIVGQVMDGCRAGGVVYPRMKTFADTYEGLPK